MSSKKKETPPAEPWRMWTAEEEATFAQLLEKKEAQERHDNGFAAEVLARKDKVAEILGIPIDPEAKDKAFWDEVEARKTEIVEKKILSRWDVLDYSEIQTLSWITETATKYGCTIDELKEHVASDQQTNYYRKTHTSYSNTAE